MKSRWFTRLTLALTLLLGAGSAAWFLVIEPRRKESLRQAVLERLPALPSFARQSRASVDLFLEADRKARREPLLPGTVGRLGMTYHAYRFVAEARRCYRIAQALEPRDYRWVYYQAMLEKSEFQYRDAERLFQRAIQMRPRDVEAWAELGDLFLKANRLEDARPALDHALELEPRHPLAASGRARLAMLSGRWQEVVRILGPVLDAHPRLSEAHKYLARAYGELGEPERQEYHRARSEYGAPADSTLMTELYEIAIPPILEGGDPARGPELLERKCARCHTHTRIYDTRQTRHWWGETVRRMQRLSGWAWLTDEEAASLVAYLVERTPEGTVDAPERSPDP